MNIVNITRIYKRFLNTSNLFVFRQADIQLNSQRWQYCYTIFVTIFFLTVGLFFNSVAAEEPPFSVSPTLATPGQTVTVNGEGFQEGARALVWGGGPMIRSIEEDSSRYHLHQSGNFVYMLKPVGYGLHSRIQIYDVSNPQTPVLVKRTGAALKPIVPGGNNSTDVASISFAGNFAYVQDDTGLQVLDISNPRAPVVVGSAETPAGTDFVVVTDNFAYVLDRDFNDGSFLQVIDISNPRSPTLAGSVESPKEADHVMIAGNFAYILDYDFKKGNSLQVIDISNPHSPYLRGSIDFPGYLSAVALAGNFVYVASNGTFLAVDISNPDSLAVVGSIDTLRVNDIAIAGNYAYLATPYHGLQVIDISKPESPVIAGSLDTSGNSSRVTITLAGNFAYIGENRGALRVIDISQPHAPALINSFKIDDYVVDFIIVDNFTYVLFASIETMRNDTIRFVLIDSAELQRPEVVSSADTVGFARDVTIDGNFAYVADGSGLQVIDINNPQAPVVIGSLDTPKSARRVTIAGNFVYMLANHKGRGDLQVIDISHPQTPVLVDSLELGGYLNNITLSGNFAYVCVRGHLQVIDVSNSGSLVMAGSVDINSYWASDVAIAGTFAYVADATNRSLQVIDISNPQEPIAVSSVATRGAAKAVEIADNLAYVAVDDIGLLVIDISNPLSLMIVGKADIPGDARSITLTGNLASVISVMGRTSILTVIDITHPQEPVIIGSTDTPGWAEDVAISGNFIYIADGSSGLSILPSPSSASTVFNNTTSLDVVLPAILPDGPYDIIVLNPDGTVYKKRHSLTITALAPDPGDLDNDGDIDKDDLNIILAARNTSARSEDDPRDLDGDGKITGLDIRKLTLLCTRPRCATE